MAAQVHASFPPIDQACPLARRYARVTRAEALVALCSLVVYV
jgi:hypothetical protein